MKKILSISLIAAMAALPMGANAMQSATINDGTNNTANDAAVIATAKYVKQAYNALVEGKQDSLSEGQLSAINTLTTAGSAQDSTFTNTATGNNALSSSTIKTAINELATEKQNITDSTVSGTLRSGTHLTTGNGVGANLVSLDTAVGNLDTTVGNSSSGLVKSVGDLESTVGDSSNGLVKDVATLQTNLGNLTASNIASTYATQTGAAATVDAATGSVTIGTGNGESTPLTVSATTENVNNLAFSGNVNVPTSGTVSIVTDWTNPNTATSASVQLGTTSTTVTGTIGGTVSVSGTATGTISGIDVAANGYQAS